MEKYVHAKRYGEAWHMFACPRAGLWIPLLQQQVESFVLLLCSNTRSDVGVILLLCLRMGKSSHKVKNKLLRTVR